MTNFIKLAPDIAGAVGCYCFAIALMALTILPIIYLIFKFYEEIKK